MYHLKPNTLEKQYKNHLSDYREFQVNCSKELEQEVFVFPENFTEDMAIDETGLVDGELYTIILNKKAKGKKGALAALIRGTKSKLIVDAVFNKVPYRKLISIKEITLDLANNMDWIARQIVPNGKHTYDRFHVQQLVTEALQIIRIKYRWDAIEEENKLIFEAKKNKIKYSAFRYSNEDTKKQLLARSRYLLFKPSNKWNKSQKIRSNILFKEFPKLKTAYTLSMCFRGGYHNSFNKEKAIRKFNQWFSKVEMSDIEEMKIAAESVKRNIGGILNYFDNRSTNANIESFNAKLKLFRRNTRGVKDKYFFLYRIIKYFS